MPAHPDKQAMREAFNSVRLALDQFQSTLTPIFDAQRDEALNGPGEYTSNDLFIADNLFGLITYLKRLLVGPVDQDLNNITDLPIESDDPEEDPEEDPEVSTEGDESEDEATPDPRRGMLFVTASGDRITYHPDLSPTQCVALFQEGVLYDLDRNISVLPSFNRMITPGDAIAIFNNICPMASR